MTHKTVRYCDVCGEPVYEGHRYVYDYPEGYEREDEDGVYFEGAGECKRCGKVLCVECGGFDADGVCADCRDE